MDDITTIIIAAIITGLVGFIINKLILKYWPKTGKFGMNFGEVYCPNCAEKVPKNQKPANLRQTLWGGCTCHKCGTEMDKYGSKIDS